MSNPVIIRIPLELIKLIGYKLSYQNVLRLCLMCKNTYRLHQNDDFWKHKGSQLLQITAEHYEKIYLHCRLSRPSINLPIVNSHTQSYREFYMDLETYPHRWRKYFKSCQSSDSGINENVILTMENIKTNQMLSYLRPYGCNRLPRVYMLNSLYGRHCEHPIVHFTIFKKDLYKKLTVKKIVKILIEEYTKTYNEMTLLHQSLICTPMEFVKELSDIQEFDVIFNHIFHYYVFSKNGAEGSMMEREPTTPSPSGSGELYLKKSPDSHRIFPPCAKKLFRIAHIKYLKDIHQLYQRTFLNGIRYQGKNYLLLDENNAKGTWITLGKHKIWGQAQTSTVILGEWTYEIQRK